jgi:hypothetical protein
MKVNPKELTIREELKLKLGIKSSVPNAKSLIMSIYTFYKISKSSTIEYSEEYSLNGATKVRLHSSLTSEMLSFFADQISISNLNDDTFIDRLNSSPLFEGKLDHIGVAIQLIWKLGEINFVDNTVTIDKERGTRDGAAHTDRFNRKLTFSTNMDIIDNVLSNENGILEGDVKNLLFNYITGENLNISNIEIKLIKILTVFSEEAKFKIRDQANPPRDLIFQQEGVYSEIIDGNTVINVDPNKNVGPFRILLSSVKENLNYYLESDSTDGFKLKSGVLNDDFENYFKRVNSYLNLNPKTTNIEIIEDAKKAPAPYLSARNQIFYGAPGTGKSYYLNELAEDKFDEDNTKRVTFHPSYSYQQFVGSYKPSPIYKTINKDPEGLYKIIKPDKEDDQFEPLIDYTFVPGPFMEMLVEALKAENNEKNYLLIIEEINRANVASVFGDVFQLLDRGSKGESTYAVTFNTDIKNHLESKGITDKMIRIPKNLHIWATMNNADQGVMPLDTAFKRRWSFKYISIDEFEDAMEGETIRLVDKCYDWNEFRHELNGKLKAHVHEDKLIGPFFMNRQELKDPDIVLSKLVLYLREDVLRHNPSLLFGTLKTFSDISEEFKVDHKKVFKALDWNNRITDMPCIEPLSEEDEEDGDSVDQSLTILSK